MLGLLQFIILYNKVKMKSREYRNFILIFIKRYADVNKCQRHCRPV